jgi:hypothetical protein
VGEGEVGSVGEGEHGSVGEGVVGGGHGDARESAAGGEDEWDACEVESWDEREHEVNVEGGGSIVSSSPGAVAWVKRGKGKPWSDQEVAITLAVLKVRGEHLLFLFLFFIQDNPFLGKPTSIWHVLCALQEHYEKCWKDVNRAVKEALGSSGFERSLIAIGEKAAKIIKKVGDD